MKYMYLQERYKRILTYVLQTAHPHRCRRKLRQRPPKGGDEFFIFKFELYFLYLFQKTLDIL